MASLPADEIALHTSALQACSDTSATCHHLLSRSAAFLLLHSSSPAPSLAARAVRDAAEATTISPRLPASWLALFSAHIAAGSQTEAASALDSGLRFCPQDHAIRFARASLANPSPIPQTAHSKSQTPQPSASQPQPWPAPPRPGPRPVPQAQTPSPAPASTPSRTPRAPTPSRLKTSAASLTQPPVPSPTPFLSNAPTGIPLDTPDYAFVPVRERAAALTAASPPQPQPSTPAPRHLPAIAARPVSASKKVSPVPEQPAVVAAPPTAPSPTSASPSASVPAPILDPGPARVRARARARSLAPAPDSTDALTSARTITEGLPPAPALVSAPAPVPTPVSVQPPVTERAQSPVLTRERLSVSAPASAWHPGRPPTPGRQHQEIPSVETRPTMVPFERTESLRSTSSQASLQVRRGRQINRDSTSASTHAPSASVVRVDSLSQLGLDDPVEVKASTPTAARRDVPRYSRSRSAGAPSLASQPEFPIRGEETPASILRSAESRLAGRSYDEAIAKYTRLLLLYSENPSSYYIQALAGRSDAYLQKARAADDATSFVHAAADARKLVSLRPTWDDAWLRLGAAHLENGCPARAKMTFEQGLQSCPSSSRLKEGLRDAQYVIETEGPETDWEDDSGDELESESDQDGFQEPQITTSDASRQRGLPPRLQTDAAPQSIDSWNRLARNGENGSRQKTSMGGERRLPGGNRVQGERRVRSTMEREMRTREASEQGMRERDAHPHEELDRDAMETGQHETLQQDPQEDWPRDFSEPLDASSSSAGVGSWKLYELLQVPRDATSAHIKKSYYNLARKYHPDKNKDDAEATDRFQRLAEAYRVLSDPESRAVYDKYGDKGLGKNSVDVIDPSTLFAMVFGSDQFVKMIGELQLASLANNVDENGTAPSTTVLDNIQRRRVGKLVLEMVKTLKPWVDGDKKGFLAEIHRQMRRLREASFGTALLQTVGNVYVQQTSYLLDKTKPFNLPAVLRKASLRSHKMSSHNRALSAASRVMDKQRKLHDRIMRTGRDNRSISDDEATRIAVEMAQNAIDMMWKISVIDIESTLEDVVAIVLSGRDLVTEDLPLSNDQPRDPPVEVEKSRRRLRITSHLGMDRRDQQVRDNGERHELGLVRPCAQLTHGERAVTRQQILSERAYGIQAIGRIFMSADR